ncbi:MAG: 4-oxalocrotonate tautomerase [Gammaproteobacteria bacterium]|jgi:phenylpyruvate tautomerase PptA (4-oxalocrotonate tautomerase family)|nr:4-oxalocrotonate tautomerase [Gammaproteobacteria bacterium]
MPLVRIALLKGKSAAHIRAIADGVHQALVDTYGVPADDRFQLIQQHEPDELIYDPDYLGIRRTNDVVFINITASEGRDLATKKALYRAIAARLATEPGLRPEDVQIVISPNKREDWSFGLGSASYAKDLE